MRKAMLRAEGALFVSSRGREHVVFVGHQSSVTERTAA